jgi:hypothetical protein
MIAIQIEAYNNPTEVVKVVDLPDSQGSSRQAGDQHP